jgi:homogentisate 1,2-dioxygenase
MMGNIPFEYGDYLIIPRGVIYQIDFDTAVNRLLYVSSRLFIHQTIQNE